MTINPLFEMRMLLLKKINNFLLCLLLLALIPQLSFQHQQREARYFAFAYHYHTKKIPLFKNMIAPSNLNMFARYYKVISTHNKVIAYEVYEDQKIFGRNIVFPKHVRYERVARNGVPLFHQKLFYDDHNRLYREENYKYGNLTSYYVYDYDINGFRTKREVYDPNDHLITTTTYDHDYQGKQLSAEKKDETVDESGYEKYKLLVREFKVEKDRRSRLYKVTGKLVNQSAFMVKNVRVRVDLFSNREKLGSAEGFLMGESGQGGRIDSAGAVYFETNGIIVPFTHGRIFVYYQLWNGTKSLRNGPHQFKHKGHKVAPPKRVFFPRYGTLDFDRHKY